ncbi:MAG: hypothetical protein ABEJ80_00230 [Halarchaeum sp.]
MAARRHRELHSFLRERAGDAYRSAFRYDDDGWEAIYVRDDVRTRALERGASRAYEQIQQRQSLFPDDSLPMLGATQATTEVHENAIVMHFPESETSGTVVSLDRSAAQQLTGFVLACQERLRTPDDEAGADETAETDDGDGDEAADPTS